MRTGLTNKLINLSGGEGELDPSGIKDLRGVSRGSGNSQFSEVGFADVDIPLGMSTSASSPTPSRKPARRVRGNSQTLNITCGRTGTLGIMSN